MVIQSSQARMGARTQTSYRYQKTQEQLLRNKSTGETLYEGSSFSMMGTQEYVTNAKKIDSIEDATSHFLEQLRAYMQDMRNRLLANLGIRRNVSGSGYTFLEGSYAYDISSGRNVSIWDRVQKTSCTYEESETMEFATTGSVVTADGRKLDFQVELTMSRSYVECIEDVQMDQVAAIMTDPLVLNLDTTAACVSDQKWKFDIDGDGEMDSISMLAKGCGYLALDRNEDGRINDGTELFGARTGNGFSELAAYDEDGNGWIDEGDSIYEKLSVWLKDDSGQDRLLSLKEADVGAIYLGNASTEFALKSSKDNAHQAQVRRTGIYLSEAGVANTIQQLDMVKSLIG
ncbi:MAG: hypothetical protein ACI4EK_01880 [Wujia sp.]